MAKGRNREHEVTHVDVVCVDTLITGATEHQVVDHLGGNKEELKSPKQ